MRRDFEQLFTYLPAKEPPTGLLDKILGRIDTLSHLRALKRRLFCCALLFAACLAAFWPALKAAKSEFVASGFMDFLSLIFSDSKEILSSWQSFGLALLESLPVMSLAAVLSLLFVSLTLLKFLSHDLWISIRISNPSHSR